MQRKFITNLLFLVLINLLIKPFWIFGIDREVQNVIGVEGYGSYFALLNLSIILNIVLDAGITNYNNRNISQHNHLLGKYFGSLISLRLLLAIGYMLVCLLVAILSGYNDEAKFMLGLLCFNQFLLAGILFLRSNLAGLHLFKTDSLISVADRFLMIVLCGLGLWTTVFNQPFTINMFVILQTVAYLITAIVALILVWIKAGNVKFGIDLKLFRVILKQSLPFALLVLLMSIYNRQDAVLLDLLHPNGATQAGIYAQAFRLLDAGNMFAYLFAVLLLPIFARMLKLKQPVSELSRMSLGLLVAPATIVALVAWFYSNQIMGLLYTDMVSESQAVFPWLMLAFVSMAGSYVVGTLLTANGSLKILNTIAVIAVVISILMNVLLIPQYGAVGSAWIAAFVQSMVFVIQCFFAHRLFKAAPSIRQIGLYSIFVITSVLIGWGVASNIDNWLIGSTILITSALFISLILKLIKPMEMLQIIRSKED
ncbi:MAG: O-antigen/teichoic acid export membrane protein [Bacteroidia bacterium]|jgi:O-antigen/teichoic acid export membrane protein